MPSNLSTRRRFLKAAGNIGLGTYFASMQSKLHGLIDCIPANTKHLLLRSSWQTINIGDIAHTPGVLNILEKYLPEVKITLWAADVRDGVEEMIKSRFPEVPIIKMMIGID